LTTGNSIDRLYQVVESTFGVSATALSEESSPITVDAWDSLNHLNLVMAIESEFGVSLSAEEIIAMRNLALVRGALRAHGVDI